MSKELFYFAFDTETGGLKPQQADILTFYGGIVDSSFKVLDEVNLKLKPDGGRLPIADAGALRVNGINLQEHLANPATITYSEANVRIVAMLQKYSKKYGRNSMNIKPFGYNVPFDEKWTWHHLIPQDEWEKYMHYQRIDVMERVNFLKESGWFPSDLGSLTSVNDFLNLPKRPAHDAKNDTLMTIDVYQALLKLMESKKAGGNSQDLIALLEAE